MKKIKFKQNSFYWNFFVFQDKIASAFNTDVKSLENEIVTLILKRKILPRVNSHDKINYADHLYYQLKITNEDLRSIFKNYNNKKSTKYRKKEFEDEQKLLKDKKKFSKKKKVSSKSTKFCIFLGLI